MQNVTKLGGKLVLTGLTVLGLATTASALPILQLDIDGGQYNTSDETTYATGNSFTLQALYTGGAPLGSKFYLSAALVPTTSGGVDFGSFQINGTTYDFNSANVHYGTPPSEDAYPDLGSHGIFPTVYAEIEFEFEAVVPVNFHPAYNVQSGETTSGDLLIQQFLVDISGLNEGLALHFDLYDVFVKNGKKDSYKTGFAPFSHDAQSLEVEKETSDNPPTVPDASTTVTLMGLAMVGLGLVQRRFKK